MTDSEPLSSIPRKRRRPALSCEQCRRRKVRCDREMPCGPCTKSQPSLDCEYVYEGKAALNARIDASRLSEHESPPPGAPGVAAPSSSTDGARIAHLEATVLHLHNRVHTLEQGDHLSATHARRHRLPEDSRPLPKDDELDDHIAHLERQLAEAKAQRSKKPQTCISPLAPRLREKSGERTKLFGTTHWASVFQQVSWPHTSLSCSILLTRPSFVSYDKCAAKPLTCTGSRMRLASYSKRFGRYGGLSKPDRHRGSSIQSQIY